LESAYGNVSIAMQISEGDQFAVSVHQLQRLKIIRKVRHRREGLWSETIFSLQIFNPPTMFIREAIVKDKEKV